MTLKAQNCFLHKFHKHYNTTLLTFLFKLSNFNFGHSKKTQNSQQLYVTRETDQSSNNSCARHSRHIFNNFFFFKKVFSKHSFFLLAVVSINCCLLAFGNKSVSKEAAAARLQKKRLPSIRYSRSVYREERYHNKRGERE